MKTLISKQTKNGKAKVTHDKLSRESDQLSKLNL